MFGEFKKATGIDGIGKSLREEVRRQYGRYYNDRNNKLNDALRNEVELDDERIRRELEAVDVRIASLESVQRFDDASEARKEKGLILGESFLISSRINDPYLTLTRKQGYSNSDLLNTFRAGFFSNLYGIEIKVEDTPFFKLLGNYEFLLNHALMPTERELSDISADAFGRRVDDNTSVEGGDIVVGFSVTKAIKNNIRQFFGQGARYSPVWIFDKTCNEKFFQEQHKEVLAYLGMFKEFISTLYEKIIIFQRSMDDSAGCMENCFPYWAPESVSIQLLRKLQKTHLERIDNEIDELKENFDDLVKAYEQEIVGRVRAAQAPDILLQSTAPGSAREMGDISERTPLIVQGEDRRYDEGGAAGPKVRFAATVTHLGQDHTGF